MADYSLICPTCDQPIRLRDSVYFWPDRQTMEHLWCRVRYVGHLSAEGEASASSVYGPLS